MASVSVGVINVALVELGDDAVTDAQESKASRVVAGQYELERDALLEEHPWNFAITQAELGLVAEDAQQGYAHAFALPSDYLQAIGIVGSDINYVISGSRLHCDASRVVLRYVRDATDPSLWPSSFQVALGLRLARRCAKKITSHGSTKDRMIAEYEKALKIAKNVDARGSGQPRPERPKAFIGARARVLAEEA